MISITMVQMLRATYMTLAILHTELYQFESGLQLSQIGSMGQQQVDLTEDLVIVACTYGTCRMCVHCVRNVRPLRVTCI